MSLIYISGKITGDRDYREKFHAAEVTLWERGWDVFNPASLPDGLDIRRTMGIDLAAVLAADAVFALPDYRESKGALVETALADRIGIPVWTDFDQVPERYEGEE